MTNEKKTIDQIFDRLFPLLRSITGPGIEESLQIMAEYMPLSISGVPSGTQVFDWTTPNSWHCKSAILTGPNGEKICDLSDSNLHVVNYSIPIDAHLSLAELQKHLHSLHDLPDAIPYVTSYYKPNWGFCLKQSVRDMLRDGVYHAKIDAEFTEGRVPLADCFIEGNSKKEILLSSYLCHPSLANNELSGPLVLLGLYHRIIKWPKRRHRFRFVLNPETIGSLCYLHVHGDYLKENLWAGVVLTCLGGPDKLSYMFSRRGDTPIDQLAKFWHSSNQDLRLRKFMIDGSDERQYCSPGFNLPVAQIARTVYGEYDGYHNSLDTKEFMNIDSIIKSIDEIELFLKELDAIGPYVNLFPYGEPQLGRRGLYPNLNSPATWATASTDDIFDGRAILERILFVLNYSDGEHDLIEIARHCKCSVSQLVPIVEKLISSGLLSDKERGN